jgi:hypothetical protein
VKSDASQARSIAYTQMGSMSFPVERAPAALGHPAHTPTERHGVVSVEGAVKGGRSPAKRTLYCVRNANTLKGLGLVAAFRGQPPSPSGGEDFPALGGGARGGGARRARQGSPPHRGRFHRKRPKPPRWHRLLWAKSFSVSFWPSAASGQMESDSRFTIPCGRSRSWTADSQRQHQWQGFFFSCILYLKIGRYQKLKPTNLTMQAIA